jgi:hypothetical protein
VKCEEQAGCTAIVILEMNFLDLKPGFLSDKICFFSTLYEKSENLPSW